MTLVPTLKLSLEMTKVLTRIEMNGLKINLDTLDEIEKEYNEELSYLDKKLQTMAKEAVGDTTELTAMTASNAAAPSHLYTSDAADEP